jgi:hypothetical protein
MIGKTITLVLLFVYFAVIFQPAFKYAAFKINQEFIVDNLCVQKDMEDNYCQGSCYLSQEMEESAGHSSKSTVPSKIEITGLNFDFFINEKSDSKQFFNMLKLTDFFFSSPINKEHKPLVPPPKS